MNSTKTFFFTSTLILFTICSFSFSTSAIHTAPECLASKEFNKTSEDLSSYNAFIEKFPTSNPIKLDYTQASIFNRQEVVFYQSNNSKDKKLKKNLKAFIDIITSEAKREDISTSISDIKNQSEKSIAKAHLKSLIRDLTHLQTVFAPKDTKLSSLISEANNAVKTL